MGGEETVKRLHQIDPEVRAVVSSGYAESVAIADYQSCGFRACLAKPYKVVALRDTLSDLMRR